MLYTGINKALATVRERRNLGPGRAAKKCGVQQAQWSKWESNAHRPQDFQLDKVLSGLGCTEAELGKEAAKAAYLHYCAQNQDEEEVDLEALLMLEGITAAVEDLDWTALDAHSPERIALELKATDLLFERNKLVRARRELAELRRDVIALAVQVSLHFNSIVGARDAQDSKEEDEESSDED